MRLIIFVSILLITFNVLILLAFGINVFALNFIQELFTNLLPNTVAILIGVLVVNLLIENNRSKKLKDINKSKSEFIEFLLNRFSFKLLEYLDLASIKEPAASEDKEVNFDWANKRMMEKLSKIDEVFYSKMIVSSDREKFVKGFVEEIEKSLKSLSAQFKEIYPHPSPTIVSLSQHILYSAGGLHVIGTLDGITKEANKKIVSQQGTPLTSRQADLLLKLAYSNPSAKPSKICGIILQLHQMSKDNVLYADL